MEEILRTWPTKAHLFPDLVMDNRTVPDRIAKDYFGAIPKVEYPNEQPDVIYPLPVEKQSMEWVDADGNPVKFPLQLRMNIKYRQDLLKYAKY